MALERHISKICTLDGLFVPHSNRIKIELAQGPIMKADVFMALNGMMKYEL
jgi:hypothetical protein